MMNLLVREVYPPTWLVQSRRFWVAGLFVALGGAVVGGVGGASDIGWLGGALIGGIGGSVFLLVVAGGVLPMTVQMTNGLYYGHENVCGSVPVGAFEYRLVCALVSRSGTYVGGVLYLGRDRVFFAAHRKNWKPDRYAVDFGPAATLTTARRDRPSEWYLRWQHRREGSLELSSPNATKQFYVPSPDAALEALRKALEKLAAKEPSAHDGH